ncbi:unnamed protein product, partial [Sphacelaria rigidula]
MNVYPKTKDLCSTEGSKRSLSQQGQPYIPWYNIVFSRRVRAVNGDAGTDCGRATEAGTKQRRVCHKHTLDRCDRQGARVIVEVHGNIGPACYLSRRFLSLAHKTLPDPQVGGGF